MIEVTTVLTKKIQKSMTKKVYVSSWIALIIGLIGLLSYFFVDEPWANWLMVFALPFGFGLVYIITLTKLYKKPMNEKNVNIYQFDNDYITIINFTDGQTSGILKVFYNQIIKIKETKGYLLLFLTKFSALPVSKENLNDNELQTLKALLTLQKKLFPIMLL